MIADAGISLKMVTAFRQRQMGIETDEDCADAHEGEPEQVESAPPCGIACMFVAGREADSPYPVDGARLHEEVIVRRQEMVLKGLVLAKLRQVSLRHQIKPCAFPSRFVKAK